MKGAARSIEVHVVDNGTILSVTGEPGVCKVYPEGEERELLKDLCIVLSIGSDVIDWSEEAEPDAPDEGAQPGGKSIAKISVSDI